MARAPTRIRFAAALLLATVVPAWAASAEPAATAAEAATPLSSFDRFELVDPVLATELLGPDGNERARRELQMHLRDALGPWLAKRNAAPVHGAAPRTLRIVPEIVLLAYVDPAVHLAAGALPNRERLGVRVRFVEAATGEAVAETTLQADGSALAGIAPLGATASALPARIAADLRDYLDAAVTDAAPAAP